MDEPARPTPDRTSPIPDPWSLIPDDSRAPVPGLYVHVPFCTAICSYCNFNRGLHDPALSAKFVGAVRRELRSMRLARPADTLYFGGGTPSLLAPADIEAIVRDARDGAGLTADAEVTLEANPESVSPATLEQFRLAGINRLSFGVQSFRDEELVKLGRLHTAGRAKQAMGFARSAGFDNISLDLMMWLPGQSLDDWAESVEAAVALEPAHLSLYILEVYPHLPLREHIDRFGWLQASDETAADMYESAMARLDAAGYVQYEISNVAVAGRQSRHNLKYWSDGEWFGFGPGAHSTARGQRWRNVSSTDDYVRRVDGGASVVAERRTLSEDERLGDALFTGLRLTSGFDLEIMSIRYATDVWARFGGALAPYVEAGLLLRQDGRLRLTRRGMLMANDVMSVFV